MEISNSLASGLRRVFTNCEDNNGHSLEEHLTLDSNNVFKRNLIIDVSNDEMEIPVIARGHIENTVAVSPRNGYKVDKVLLPLYNNSRAHFASRTFDSAIRQMFMVPYHQRLQKIITNKGEVYHGGKGIIFDESYSPLLLCTLAARVMPQEDNTPSVVYYRPTCRVSPKVFSDPDKLINKGIIKKVIPYYTNHDVTSRLSRSIFTYAPENRKVEVIVDNFDKFFVEPIKPTPSTCPNSALNDCLVDNIEDVLSLI